MIKKIFLATAFVLLSATMSFAQSVQVPNGCTVLNVGTGTGGVLGLNGIVTNDGIVAMPDPLSGTMSFVTAPGITFGGWTLKGDLSFNKAGLIFPPNTGYAAVQTSSSMSPIIMSYNENFRTSEGIAPSVATWARSKGLVRLDYSFVSGGCSGKANITFQVFKTYTNNPITNIPKIVGPSCIEPGIPCTFSVDQIASDNANDNIGFDKYYWKGFPANVTNKYYSADNSSITFTPPAAFTPFVLTCGFGRANPWDSTLGPDFSSITPNTTIATFPVGTVPVAPSYTPNTGIPTCLTTGTTSFTISIAPITNYSYVWTSSNNAWVITQSGQQNSILNIAIGDNNPTKLTLTITNGSCTPKIIDYVINRTFAPSLAITGLGAATPTTCISSPTFYSLPQNALGNLVDWKILPAVTNGPSIAGVGNPNAATCSVNPGTVGGVYKIYATAQLATTCTSTQTFLEINVKPAAPLFAATPTCVVKGTTPITSISVTPTASAGYVWNITGAPGWSISANANSSNPTFIPNGSNNDPVTITATLNGTNSCNSNPATKTINYIAIVSGLNAGTSFSDQYAVSCGTVTSWVVNGSVVTSSTPNTTITGGTLLISGNGTPVTSVCANVLGVTGLICASPSVLGTHGLRQSGNNTIDDKNVTDYLHSVHKTMAKN